jgi:hypothetical protein
MEPLLQLMLLPKALGNLQRFDATMALPWPPLCCLICQGVQMYQGMFTDGTYFGLLLTH